MRSDIIRALVATAMTGLSGAAFAQAAQPPATAVPPGSSQTIPEKNQAAPETNPGSGTLSEKLDKSSGVIKPPSNIDPSIAKPAPVTDPGTMPVVKPPEERGGPVAK